MNYEETKKYIGEISKTGSVLGLKNICRLMEVLDNPQEKVRAIHVAGTNGKGSVSAMLESILIYNGYRVGRYSSPAVFEYEEIFKINGKPIEKTRLAQLFTRVREACDTMTKNGWEHPTVFEAETAAAYEYFWEENCDFAIVEVGMGGREDATNVLRAPFCSIITSVSRDHCAILGDTLAEIAMQKAGIIKPQSPVVIGIQDREALEVLLAEAKKQSAPAYSATLNRLGNLRMELDGIRCRDEAWGEIQVPLTGMAQQENLALTLTVLDVLAERGVSLSEEKVREALKRTVWQGRFEILRKNPYVIIDGAHNPDAAGKLAETLRVLLNEKRLIFIAGVFKDKEYDKVMEAVLPLGERVFTVKPPGDRGLPAPELCRIAERLGVNAKACDSVEEAVSEARACADSETVILSFGSLSYLNQLRKAVDKIEWNM